MAALGDAWRVVGRDGDGQITLHTTAHPMDIVRTLAGLGFEDVTIEPPSLEEVFLAFYHSPAGGAPP